MKFITYAENKTQLEKLASLVSAGKVNRDDLEVIVGTRTLSRYSEMGLEELLELVTLNQSLKLPLVLEWDVLQQESLFLKNKEIISRLPLHEFKAIRVQDPGALNTIAENLSLIHI